MSERAASIAKRISAVETPIEEPDDSLLLAHEIIAMVRMANFDPIEPALRGETFDESDVRILRDALVDYARRFPDHASRGSAYWGLAALYDPNERKLFRRLLELESTKEEIDEGVLWQLMIALDNIDEDILTPIQSDSVDQAGDRWAASRLYLARTQ
jgi:hypothetical protein